MTPAGTDCEFYHCEKSSFTYFSFINILCEKKNSPSENILPNYASATILSVPNYLAKRSHLLATFCNVEYGISSLYFKLMLLGYGVFIDYGGAKFCLIFQEILIELIYWSIQHISMKKTVICIMYGYTELIGCAKIQF